MNLSLLVILIVRQGQANVLQLLQIIIVSPIVVIIHNVLKAVVSIAKDVLQLVQQQRICAQIWMVGIMIHLLLRV